MREGKELPPPTQWPKRPVFLSVNTPAVGKSFNLPDHDVNGPMPLGVPFDFESEIFKGQCLFRIKDVESDDQNSPNYDGYFDNRRRLWQVVVQGQFKEEMLVADVFQGTEHVRPFKHLPPYIITRPIEKLLALLSGHGCINELFTNRPRIMACVGSFSRAFRADEPGSVADIRDINLEDNCTAFGGIFKPSKKISRSKRSKYLSTPKNQCKFDPKLVHTFEYYDHQVDFSKGELDLFGLARYKHSRLLDGQPMNATCRTRDGRYAWFFQMWHEDLLEAGMDATTRTADRGPRSTVIEAAFGSFEIPY
jgi:hypothetical protein